MKRRDSEVWALARKQQGVVTRAQLVAVGFTRSAISHRLRTRKLWRVHAGVFAVGRPELSPLGVWLAAVLACGEGAVLSHMSAARLWEIRDQTPLAPHVSVPTDNGRPGPAGIELHRASSLLAKDVAERNAIPVTTLQRTLIDLAAVLDEPELKRAVRQSERVHRLDLAQLRTSLDDLPVQSVGPARLRRLLDGYVPARTDSELEAAFLELCGRRGLPLPETQVPIGRYRADFVWRDLRLIVETDGRAAHDGFVAFREDRVRDRALKAAGFEVLRFTGAEVAREAAAVGRELAQVLRRRSNAS